SAFLRKSFFCLCFFFQAEDGIRDLIVTGVQTCALPILALHDQRATASVRPGLRFRIRTAGLRRAHYWSVTTEPGSGYVCHPETRSEERRVGKECRSRGSR